MSVININIGKQSRTVMRVLDEFDKRSERAYHEHGRLEIFRDGLPLIVSSIFALYPRMRTRRRLELSAQVFSIVQNMHRLAHEKPPTDAVQ